MIKNTKQKAKITLKKKEYLLFCFENLSFTNLNLFRISNFVLRISGFAWLGIL